LDIKDFTDAKVQGELKDDEAFKAIKDGIRDKEGRLRMKAAEGLSDDEIKALVQYVHDFKKEEVGRTNATGLQRFCGFFVL